MSVTMLKAGIVVLALLLMNLGIRLGLQCRRPLRQSWNGMLSGTAALAFVHFTGLLTHVSVPFGPLTAGWAAVTGIPGVITLLFAQLLTQSAVL
ncbi:MAG: pro-sigmaK processing inhibitor BofA family protein [Clostridia bacterium]|nr:pro-sigmaK processing inhibitor BofA family protein [Clostridia bacterium]